MEGQCAPNLAYLKVWGCLVKVLFLDVVFIGYVENSQHTSSLWLYLRIYHILEAKNVDFFEIVFPMQTNVEVVFERIIRDH